jgi:PTH1 family peptidyl-tRNA hydrolase
VKAIIGLGNPGLRYKSTRHNVGFLVVRRLARANRIRIQKRVFNLSFGKGTIGKQGILLGLPLTFMNLSGEAVASVVKRHKIELKDLLVICDDINLPLGKIRIRPKGTDGGHKGLRSIIQKLGSEDFSRLRIGIGFPQEEVKECGLRKYVLARFNKKETKIVEQVVEEAVQASQVWAKEGIATCMNKFN